MSAEKPNGQAAIAAWPLSCALPAVVDGFLARLDNSLDFLENGEQEPHGFEEFFNSVDVVVIGRKTFEVVSAGAGRWRL